MGLNLVRNTVEAANHVLQEIHLENDLGNDAYLEFVQEEAATGCCVALQVKTGRSYRLSGQRGYSFRGDRDHFEYWRDHALPVAGIVVDPERNLAVWIDITDHLRHNPQVIENGPYSVTVPLDSRLDGKGFAGFEAHFLAYRTRFNSDAHFGSALESFAAVRDEQICFDGLRALFSFHRARLATWFYLTTSLRWFDGHPLSTPMAVVLSHLEGHGDIFWHKGNIIPEKARDYGRALIREGFGRREVLVLLGAIDDKRIDRGTVGQCVHALIDGIMNVEDHLRSISLDESVDGTRRYWALLLLVYRVQVRDPPQAVRLLKDFAARYPAGRDVELVEELATTIQEHGHFGMY